MQTHELVQGTPQWVAHRFAHFNASDAPAMMGVSPYKSRSDLLRELATGLGEEVNGHTQSLFDRGHRFEALARPIAEEIIGQELYPVVGTEGRLSASFDGLTLLEEVAFEHKTLNADLRAAIRQDGGNANEFLAPMYRVQMEQQCMVAGCDRVLFLTTTWTDDDVLVEKRYCWYTADPQLAQEIARGWDQFALDLEAWKPTASTPVVTAAAVENLPALSVRLQGALAVVSNLEPFGVALRAFVDRIPKKPSTDQEFADTEAACKRLKEAEDRLQAAEDSALAGMSDVETMRRMVADFRDLARTTRLASEKLVKQRKEQIREEEVARGHGAMVEHLAALNKRLGGAYIAGLAAGSFGAVIKGLKSLDSVRNAIDTELARAKIEASALADKIDANLKAIAAAGAPTLFPDKAALVLKAADDLAAIIAQRLAAEQKRQDDERERIRAEEQQRADRERRQMLASELAGIRQQAAIAAVGRAGVRNGGTLQCALDTLAETEAWPLPAEHWGDMLPLAQETKDAAIAEIRQVIEFRQQAAAQQNSEARESQQVLKAEPATADATDRDAPATASPRVGAMGVGQAADAAAAGVVLQSTNYEPGAKKGGWAVRSDGTADGTFPEAAAAADTRPPINVGAINRRLPVGLSLTRAGIEGLGITPAGFERGIAYWSESAWPSICEAIRDAMDERIEKAVQ